jgi:hypothetical protein
MALTIDQRSAGTIPSAAKSEGAFMDRGADQIRLVQRRELRPQLGLDDLEGFFVRLREANRHATVSELRGSDHDCRDPSWLMPPSLTTWIVMRPCEGVVLNWGGL